MLLASFNLKCDIVTSTRKKGNWLKLHVLFSTVFRYKSCLAGIAFDMLSMKGWLILIYLLKPFITDIMSVLFVGQKFSGALGWNRFNINCGFPSLDSSILFYW